MLLTGRSHKSSASSTTKQHAEITDQASSGLLTAQSCSSHRTKNHPQAPSCPTHPSSGAGPGRMGRAGRQPGGSFAPHSTKHTQNLACAEGSPRRRAAGLARAPGRGRLPAALRAAGTARSLSPPAAGALPFPQSGRETDALGGALRPRLPFPFLLRPGPPRSGAAERVSAASAPSSAE